MVERARQPGIIRFFFESYPYRTAIVTVLMLAANLLEGIGVLALLSILTTLLNGGAAQAPGGGAGEIFSGIFEWIGIEMSLTSLLACMVLLMFGKGALFWVALRQSRFAAVAVVTECRLQLLSNLFRSRWSYFVDQRPGDLANALSGEAQATADAFDHLCRAFAAAWLALVYAVIVLVISWQAFFIWLVVMLVASRAFQMINVASRRVGVRLSHLRRNLVGDLVSAVQGMRPIRAMAQESGFEPQLRSRADGIQVAERHNITLSTILLAFFEPVLTLVICSFLWLGSQMDYGLAELSIIVFAVWRVSTQVQYAHGHYRELSVNEPFFLSLQSTIRQAAQARESAHGTQSPPQGLVDIKLEQISFSYDTNQVFDNASLTIPAGKLTVFKGPSGVGKSTLIDILLGLQEPSSGCVMVGEIPLSDITLTDWRRKIGYVPQEVALFHDTVFENVVMGDGRITESDVRAALQSVGALDFVSALPQGLATPLGERGTRLSGGQKQRIAIARALVRNPELLILDEATTALDPESEQAIVDVVLQLRGTTTILAVSHQPVMVRAADVEYRLHGGKVRLEERDQEQSL